MLCILFGHAPGRSMTRLAEQMRNPGFECRRCRSIVMWRDMPRKILRMRDEYLRRIGADATGKRPANDDSLTTIT